MTLRLDLGLGFILILLDLFLTAWLTVTAFYLWMLFPPCCGWTCSPPLHLDKFHPYGCEFQALIPKKLQTKFGAKTIRTVFMDYDFSSMCYIVAALPHMALKQTAHGVFNDESFPLREAASATSWGGLRMTQHALIHWHLGWVTLSWS